MDALTKEREIELGWRQHLGPPRVVGNNGLRRRLAAEQGWRCCYCGRPVHEGAGRGGDAATAEHVVPRAMGGPDEEANIAVACSACNVRRGHSFWPAHLEAARAAGLEVPPAAMEALARPDRGLSAAAISYFRARGVTTGALPG